MSIEMYKVIHILGALFLIFSLGGATMLSINRAGGAKSKGSRISAITHGVALLLILVAGFGLLAKLGYAKPGSWGLWIWAKLIIWLVLGAMMTLTKRIPSMARALWIVIPILAAIAAYMAIFKP